MIWLFIICCFFPAVSGCFNINQEGFFSQFFFHCHVSIMINNTFFVSICQKMFRNKPPFCSSSWEHKHTATTLLECSFIRNPTVWLVLFRRCWRLWCSVNTSLLLNEHFWILQQHKIKVLLSKLLWVALSKGHSFAVLKLTLICRMT